MPRGKPQRRTYQLPLPPSLQQLAPSIRQQCCVVCYTNFTPFEFNSEVWDSNMIKNFYTSLDIVNSLGSGEEDEEILSLPFCPQCHTKVSVMAAYQIELQNIKSKCNSIRNDLAFTVVETIGQNSRDGPIDYIRQQIFDKWKLTYEDHKAKVASASADKLGLEYIASEPSSAPHNCGNFVCVCSKDSGKHLANAIIENNPRNGFDYDVSDFVETRNIKTAINDAPIPSWKTGSGIPKMMKKPNSVGIDRPPPLLSPQKMPYNSQTGFRGKIGARISRIPMGQQKGKISLHAMSHGQRSFGPSRSIMTPNSNVRRKVDFSHVKPTVPTRFLTTIKGKIQLPNPSKYEDGNEIENKDSTADTDVVLAEIEGPIGKRKLSDTDVNGTPTKHLKESHSPSPHVEGIMVVALADPGATSISPPRPTRNSSRSPAKVAEESWSKSAAEEGVFPCSYCPKVYGQKSRLLRHESDQHPQCKMFQCDFDNCGKGFSSKEAIKRHVHNNHNVPQAEIELHKCTVIECRKTFLSTSSLEKHCILAHGLQKNTPEKAMIDDEEKRSELEKSVNAAEIVVLGAGTEMVKITDLPEIDAKVDEVLTSGKTIEISSGEGSEDIAQHLNSKAKRKQTINRLFGVRRRKRGAGKGKGRLRKTLDQTEENSLLAKRRPPKRPPVALEAVRKSSRQRGVHLELGKPMYPPSQAKYEGEKGEDNGTVGAQPRIVELSIGTTADSDKIEISASEPKDKGSNKNSGDEITLYGKSDESAIIGRENTILNATFSLVSSSSKLEDENTSSIQMGTCMESSDGNGSKSPEKSDLIQTALDATYTLDESNTDEINKVTE